MRLELLCGSVAVASAAIVVAQLDADGGLDSPKTLDIETEVGSPAAGGGIGPDVIYSDLGGISSYGPIGGIRAYALGSHTCNIGDQDLLWTNDGTPGLAMNAYRLYDGRLMQIGMSWVKHACCAVANDGCGLDCNGHGGNVLGAGCRDVYSSSWNGFQSNLGPHSGINPYTGEFSSIPGGNGNAIFRRLQIAESDLNADNFPDALYFVAGVYVGTDDAQWANWLNNSSYKRVTVGGNFSLNEVGKMQQTIPAIYAWHDHGNGINVPDKSVQLVNVDVPDEGRFIAAAKASDNGDGTWRYEYALFNLNSHRSGGSLSVPIPPGAAVSNVGFHDADYHSGEVYDNTDWEIAVGDTSVVWSSPATFAENPDTNALRWGTMYNFWFDADVEPASGDVTLGLFRPGIPESVAFAVMVPRQSCVGDIDGDGDVGVKDLLILLGTWGPCPPKGDCPADFDGSGDVGVKDLLVLLGVWGPCP